MGLGVLDDRVEVLVRLLEGLALGGNVAIVPAPVRGIDLLKELEGRIHARLGHGELVLTFFPWPGNRAGAERIGTGAAEGMPVSDAEAHVRLHRLAVDYFG